MRRYTLEPMGNRDVTFVGEELACSTGSTPYIHTTYTLYKTQAGRLVLHRITESIMGSKEEKIVTHEDEEALVDAMGFTDSTKELYKKAGIDTTLHID